MSSVKLGLGLMLLFLAQTCGVPIAGATEMSDQIPYHLPSQWTFKSYTDLYLSGGNTKVAESTANPGNRIFEVPHSVYDFDFRENFTATFGSIFKFVLRPRFTAEQASITYFDPDGTKKATRTKGDLTDAFVEYRFKDSLSGTAGVQVYQWGPAEVISPSNPIYHFNFSQKSFFYKEKGHALARLNYTKGDTSTVLITEPVSNTEKYWIEGKDFTPQNMVKFEKNVNPSEYYGVTGGQQEGSRPFIGGYFSHGIGESGFSFYFDGRYTQGQMRYFPVLDNTTGYYNMVEPDDQKHDGTVLQDIGIRYEGNFDIRLEYLFNSAGYSKEEFKNALASATNTSNSNYASNVARFASPGLEFLGTNYLYLSIRKVDIFNFKDFNFFFRGLVSVQDGSANLQMDLDKALGDHWTIYFESSSNVGAKDKEMTLTTGQQYFLGLKLTL